MHLRLRPRLLFSSTDAKDERLLHERVNTFSCIALACSSCKTDLPKCTHTLQLNSFTSIPREILYSVVKARWAGASVPEQLVYLVEFVCMLQLACVSQLVYIQTNCTKLLCER